MRREVRWGCGWKVKRPLLKDSTCTLRSVLSDLPFSWPPRRIKSNTVTLSNLICTPAIKSFNDLSVLINLVENSLCPSWQQIDCSFCPAALYNAWYLLVYSAAVPLSPTLSLTKVKHNLMGLSVSLCWTVRGLFAQLTVIDSALYCSSRWTFSLKLCVRW